MTKFSFYKLDKLGYNKVLSLVQNKFIQNETPNSKYDIKMI